MKFHNHPAQGSGTAPAYQVLNVPGLPAYTVPAVNIEGTAYDLGNMTDTYSGSWADTPQQQAVATLMWHAAAGMQITFIPNVSLGLSANVPMALTKYFGYDKGIQIAYRDYYTLEDSAALIKAEIDAGRLVWMGGIDASGTIGKLWSWDLLSSAHAFVSTPD